MDLEKAFLRLCQESTQANTGNQERRIFLQAGKWARSVFVVRFGLLFLRRQVYKFVQVAHVVCSMLEVKML